MFVYAQKEIEVCKYQNTNKSSNFVAANRNNIIGTGHKVTAFAGILKCIAKSNVMPMRVEHKNVL